MASSTSNDIRVQFKKRLSVWALGDAYREVQQDFRYIRKVKSSPVRNILNWVNTITLDERIQVFDYLVRKACRESMECPQESIPEGHLIREYNAIYLNPTPEHRSALKQRSDGTWKPINKRLLRSTIQKLGKPVFGSDPDSSSSLGMRYKSEFQRWIVYTYINLGARTYDLEYSHFVIGPGGEHVDRSVSLLSWLGIAGQTCWEDLTDADIESAAEAVISFSSHFIKTAGSLFNDF